MDAIRFDRATQSLSERFGRRRLFGPIAAGAATYLVTLIGDSNNRAAAETLSRNRGKLEPDSYGASSDLAAERGGDDLGASAATAIQRPVSRNRHPARNCLHPTDANDRCNQVPGTPVPPQKPTCLAGGETCRIDPTTGMADFSQCCSGSGISTVSTPCLCCESDRTGVREVGEYCYPQAGNQCCLGQCSVVENEFYGMCA